MIGKVVVTLGCFAGCLAFAWTIMLWPITDALAKNDLRLQEQMDWLYDELRRLKDAGTGTDK